MHDIKDTARATVRIGYDGRVHKTFRGHFARERFDHEVRVLRYLESRGCDFVPHLLEVEPESLKMVTTNCGKRVDQLNPERQRELFASLEQYGVRHEDAELRNITYRISDGRFCIIDFEFATILDDGTGHAVTLKPIVNP
jgi:tRNA A-37 threonylcarbamoyl transferase component Bud32